MFKNKNAMRIFIILTFTLLFVSIFKLSLSYETTIDNNVRFSVPASVFTSKEESIEFDYPDIFKTYVQNFTGGEIVSHVDLLSNDPTIHGYVEVWKLDDSLSIFLEKAKAAFSPSVYNFKESFPDNNINKREWEYDVRSENNGDIHVRQYFSKDGNKLIAVSLFAPKSVWSEKYDKMYNEIKNSAHLI